MAKVEVAVSESYSDDELNVYKKLFSDAGFDVNASKALKESTPEIYVVLKDPKICDNEEFKKALVDLFDVKEKTKRPGIILDVSSKEKDVVAFLSMNNRDTFKKAVDSVYEASQKVKKGGAIYWHSDLGKWSTDVKWSELA